MTTPQEPAMHTIDRTPEYEAFMARLRDYHTKRGTTLDAEPRVGMIHLDLLKVFNHVVANGGYDKVSEEKLAWRRMAAELGLYINNEASTAFSLKEKFYKNLAAFEISTVHGKEPPPKDILEDVTAKGASLLSRTRENYRGKRESNMNATDSAASGDDGTPTRERPVVEAAAPPSSARASRGLREAPPQRVIFQPDTASSRNTSKSAGQHATHPASSPGKQGAAATTTMQSTTQPAGPALTPVRGPSILHHPTNNDNTSHFVLSYHPKHAKPLQLHPAPTPGNAPHEYPRPRLPNRSPPPNPANRQPMLPGTGFDGPNIYSRCLSALRSCIPAEQAFALNHLVKISYERGDKYRFDAFPGLAEGLVDKALEIGSLYFDVYWTLSWDSYEDSGDVGRLDGNYGTPDILDRIQSLQRKDVPDMLQTAEYMDKLVLITEAVLTLRNMVTLPENALNMSDFPPLKDLVCIIMHLPAKDSLIELKHMVLDIMEQLTPYMELGAQDPMYKTLLQQLASEDRGIILTALRALGRVSVNLEATNELADVSSATLVRISNWLLLNDEELNDACLDLLYQYTAVVSNVDHLLRSLIPENLVDQLVRLLSHSGKKVQRQFILIPEQKLPSRNEIAPVPEDLLQEMVKLEEPERVHRWVKCFFEEDNEAFVTQLAAWQAYQSAFVGPVKAMGKPMITPADFIRSSTSVYKGSNAQVLREPGEMQQKFIIHGIRPRLRPLSFEGTEYGRCLWATNAEKKNEKCGQFFLKAAQMWDHILTRHLGVRRKDNGMFENVAMDLRCTWGECFKYDRPTPVHLQDFARHINTHVMAMFSPSEAPSKRTQKPWVIPAKTMSVTYEETLMVPDEQKPNAPLEAAGIPLSAVLVLRNLARNVVKTQAQAELVRQQHREGIERGGWNERLFRPNLPRLYDVLAKNRALCPYIASLLDLIHAKAEEDDDSD